MRRDQDPSRKDPSTLTQIHTVNLFTSFPKRDLQPLTRVTVHWGKRNNQTFRDFQTLVSELTLISANTVVINWGQCIPPPPPQTPNPGDTWQCLETY